MKFTFYRIVLEISYELEWADALSLKSITNLLAHAWAKDIKLSRISEAH